MFASGRLEIVMSSTPSPTTEADPPPEGVPAPLTCSAKDGRPYVRRPDVEDQIRTALAAAPSSWNPRKLRSETLVHLVRCIRWRDGSEGDIGRLVDQIGRRVAVIVGDNAKGFPESVRDEIVEHVSHCVLKLLLAETPTRKSEFLEINFRQVVKGLTLNEVTKRIEEPSLQQFAPTSDDPENTGDQGAEFPDDGPGPDEIAQTRELCQLVRARLDAVTDPRHREAVILRYVQEWPITDQDPNTPTLTKHFGISARQIQNWINQALAQIRTAIGEEP